MSVSRNQLGKSVFSDRSDCPARPGSSGVVEHDFRPSSACHHDDRPLAGTPAVRFPAHDFVAEQFSELPNRDTQDME